MRPSPDEVHCSRRLAKHDGRYVPDVQTQKCSNEHRAVAATPIENLRTQPCNTHCVHHYRKAAIRCSCRSCTPRSGHISLGYRVGFGPMRARVQHCPLSSCCACITKRVSRLHVAFLQLPSHQATAHTPLRRCCKACIASTQPASASMWIFTLDEQPAPGSEHTAFFLPAGTHSLGRQLGTGNDIELPTDPGISRQHAKLHVGVLDVHSPLASVSSLQLTGVGMFV
jgi:hypothetical protein